MKRIREWKGSLKNKGKGRGFLANVPSSSSSRTEQRREGAGRRRPWGLAVAGKEGERRRAAWGIDSPPRFEGWRPVEAAPRRRAAAGPGRCGGGAAGPRRRLGVGENGEGSEGSLLLFSPWAGVERGRPRWPASGGQGCVRRRRWELGRRARGGECGCGVNERRRGAT